MSVVLNINGTDYFYPETGDQAWGPDATDWAVAVTSGMLQKSGGLFQLLAETNFGPNFGLKSLYFKSYSANPSSAGTLRLAHANSIGWRNQANDGDLLLTVDSSNNLLFNGSPIGTITTVSDTNSIDLSLTGTDLTADLKLSSASADPGFFVVTLSVESDGLFGQAEIASTSQTGFLSSTDWNTFNSKQSALTLGDITGTNISVTGGTGAVVGSGVSISIPQSVATSATPTFAGLTISAFTGGVLKSSGLGLISASSIFNSDVSTTAGIEFTKLQSLPSAQILVGDSFNQAVARAMTGDIGISNTGVTAIQTGVITNAMVNASAAIALNKLAAMTANRIAISDASGFLIAADTSTYPSLTELSYVKGVTSSIQTQLNSITGSGITSLTGDVTGTGPGATATTIASNVVSNSKLAQMPTMTIKGNNTGGTANADDLTTTEVTAMLDVMEGDSGSGGLKGLVPAQSLGDATKFLRGDGTWQTAGGGSTGTFAFGGGSDGNVTVTSPITLSRDMYYGNLTVSGSGSIKTNGYRVFVNGILDLTTASANAIHWNGNDGGNASGQTGGTPASAMTAVTVGGSAAGSNSGAGGAINTNGGVAQVAPPQATPSLGGPAGDSNSGGTGSGGGSGGAGRTSNGVANGSDFNRFATDLLWGITMYVGGNSSPGGPGGGGAATTDTGGGGGGGAAGGGIVYIACNQLKRTGAAAGAISAKGGNGGNGANAPGGGTGGSGSGGAGAGGGFVFLMYGTLGDATPATDLIDTSGGSGGSGGTSSSGGGNGGGAGGGGGGGGRITILDLTSGTGTVYSPTAKVAGNPRSGNTGGASVNGGSTKATL